jgi:hypothetical protein
MAFGAPGRWRGLPVRVVGRGDARVAWLSVMVEGDAFWTERVRGGSVQANASRRRWKPRARVLAQAQVRSSRSVVRR